MMRRGAGLLALTGALALLAASAPAAGGAVVRLTPAAAPPGSRVVVAGSGFAPGRRVAVRLASRTVAAALTGTDGTFTAAVPILGALHPRTRPVDVVSGRIRLALPLTIVAGRPAGAAVTVASSDGVHLAANPTVAFPGTSILVRASG